MATASVHAAPAVSGHAASAVSAHAAPAVSGHAAATASVHAASAVSGLIEGVAPEPPIFTYDIEREVLQYDVVADQLSADTLGPQAETDAGMEIGGSAADNHAQEPTPTEIQEIMEDGLDKYDNEEGDISEEAGKDIGSTLENLSADLENTTKDQDFDYLKRDLFIDKVSEDFKAKDEGDFDDFKAKDDGVFGNMKSALLIDKVSEDFKAKNDEDVHLQGGTASSTPSEGQRTQGAKAEEAG